MGVILSWGGVGDNMMVNSYGKAVRKLAHLAQGSPYAEPRAGSLKYLFLPRRKLRQAEVLRFAADKLVWKKGSHPG